ncbi:MAG: GAF domain-containing protein [Erysipelotrichaceae bacterium]
MYQHDISDYNIALQQLQLFCEDAKYNISLISNAVALLKQFYLDKSWIGFYFVMDNQLHLGPFNGLSACISIDKGKGVCGQCYQLEKTIVVNDLSLEKNHIACDSLSKSEIVVPLIIDGQMIGLIDIDAPYINAFNEEDVKFLEQFSSLLTKHMVTKQNNIYDIL